MESKKQKNSDRKDIMIIDDVKLLKKIMKTHTNLLVLFSQSGMSVWVINNYSMSAMLLLIY